MNEVISCMLSRRSVRSYQTRPVPREQIDAILRCALYAPNGKGAQLPRFFAMQKPETIEGLNQAIKAELSGSQAVEGSIMTSAISRARRADYHFIHGAPLLISAIAPRDGSNSMAECAAAVENMMLAASSMGLATCWSNQPHWLTEVPSIRRFFKDMGMRDDEAIFASLSVGFPASRMPSPQPRKEGRTILDI